MSKNLKREYVIAYDIDGIESDEKYLGYVSEDDVDTFWYTLSLNGTWYYAKTYSLNDAVDVVGRLRNNKRYARYAFTVVPVNTKKVIEIVEDESESLNMY